MKEKKWIEKLDYDYNAEENKERFAEDKEEYFFRLSDISNHREVF